MQRTAPTWCSCASMAPSTGAQGWLPYCMPSLGLYCPSLSPWLCTYGWAGFYGEDTALGRCRHGRQERYGSLSICLRPSRLGSWSAGAHRWWSRPCGWWFCQSRPATLSWCCSQFRFWRAPQVRSLTRPSMLGSARTSPRSTANGAVRRGAVRTPSNTTQKF